MNPQGLAPIVAGASCSSPSWGHPAPALPVHHPHCAAILPQLRRLSTALSLCLLLLLPSCSLRLPVHSKPVSRKLESERIPASSPSADTIPAWLIADSHHTGLVLPYDWLLESGFTPPARFPNDTRCVAMSWGNRDAYSAEGLDNPWKWFRVLLTPTPSVMELIPCNWDIVEMMPQQRIWLAHVPREQGPHIAGFLNACSRKDESGFPKVVTASSWGNGVQLESRHFYFIPRVCNVWTAQALESLGFTINPWRGITANALIRQCESPPNHFAQIWPGGGKPPSSVDP